MTPRNHIEKELEIWTFKFPVTKKFDIRFPEM